ncbi:hypothetical protein ACLOJK_000904 [Asimina triloba]
MSSTTSSSLPSPLAVPSIVVPSLSFRPSSSSLSDLPHCRRFSLLLSISSIPPLLLCDIRHGLLSPIFLYSCRRFCLFSLSSFATGTSVTPSSPYSPALPNRLLYLATSYLPALPRRLQLPL